MPFAINQGVQCHYEVEGEGPPLVLLHGLTYTLEGWRTFGYVEALKDDYQLILVDLRGSGASDIFQDPADYQMKAVLGDCLSILDTLRLDQAHIWGWSLGTEVAFRIAHHAPERVRSLVLGGGHPYERDGNPPDFFVEALGAGPERWIADWQEVLGEVPSEHVQQLQRGDPQAFVAWVYAQWPSTEAALPEMTMPALAYAGELDGYAHPLTKKYAQQMSNTEFVSLPGLDHFTSFTRSDLVLPPVLNFLGRVKQT